MLVHCVMDDALLLITQLRHYAMAKLSSTIIIHTDMIEQGKVVRNLPVGKMCLSVVESLHNGYTI